MEAAPSLVPMRLVRWEVRLLRAVPMQPLRVTTEVVREGRRLQLVEAALHGEAGEVCRASGLRVRVREDLDLPAGDGTLPPPPGPDQARSTEFVSRSHSFIETGVEMRFLHGSMRPTGPAAVWARLTCAVVEGEEPSPLTRLAAVADFGNGISALVPWESWLFINAELTVYVHRPPRGEWIFVDARTELSPAGAGVAYSVLSDEQGSIGHALQALLVDRR